ncbi:MAG: hypothetical protein MSIBF_05595 [Candidatus Altiarchaeales archaeon IMC4]|nr:MAG: hypothetical protein MSIBF_05595 [Candidatus Altiarchaeales archaeon IMC4]
MKKPKLESFYVLFTIIVTICLLFNGYLQNQANSCYIESQQIEQDRLQNNFYLLWQEWGLNLIHNIILKTEPESQVLDSGSIAVQTPQEYREIVGKYMTMISETQNQIFNSTDNLYAKQSECYKKSNHALWFLYGAIFFALIALGTSGVIVKKSK